jgi:DNA-binding GntR family transcriptional regulator
LQISEALRQQISEGAITERLPSKAELMETYGVGASTIERALQTLKANGVVESVQGAAVFVAGTGDRRPLVEKFRELLRTDGLSVGDVFPTETELSERFGASRTAVRSAIAQLEGQGLIARAAKRRRVLALPVDEKGQPS